MPPRLLLLAILAIAFGQAAAAQDINSLLGSIAPAQEKPEGGVSVEGRLEATPGGGELVVTLAPHGDARLLGDPGVAVTPGQAGGVIWTAPLPALAQREDGDYFPVPPELRLPFEGRLEGPVEVLVEYSYCFVDYQCLFGEATVTVGPPPAG